MNTINIVVERDDPQSAVPMWYGSVLIRSGRGRRRVGPVLLDASTYAQAVASTILTMLQAGVRITPTTELRVPDRVVDVMIRGFAPPTPGSRMEGLIDEIRHHLDATDWPEIVTTMGGQQ